MPTNSNFILAFDWATITDNWVQMPTIRDNPIRDNPIRDNPSTERPRSGRYRFEPAATRDLEESDFPAIRPIVWDLTRNEGTIQNPIWTDQEGTPIFPSSVVQIVGPIDNTFSRFSGRRSQELLGMRGVVLDLKMTVGWRDRLGGRELPFAITEILGVTYHILCKYLKVFNEATPRANEGEISHIRNLMSIHILPHDLAQSLNSQIDLGSLRHSEILGWETHISQYPIRTTRPELTNPAFNREIQTALTAEYKDVPSARYAVSGVYIEVARPDSGLAKGVLLVYKDRGDSRALINSITDQKHLLATILANPKKFARRYGAENGMCGLCNRSLHENSAHNRQTTIGLHYICMDKQGWELEENDEN